MKLIKFYIKKGVWIIIDVIFNYNEFLSVDEIFELINSEYSITPNKNELLENIERLLLDDKLAINSNKYSLAVDFKLKVQKIFLRNQESKKIRDNNLKEIIINFSTTLPTVIELEQISNAFYNSGYWPNLKIQHCKLDWVAIRFILKELDAKFGRSTISK